MTLKELYEEYKTWFWYSFIGAIGIIISFQVFWYTDFYNNHPYLEVLIKIILGIFSLINQTLIHDVEKAKKKAKRKKNDDYNIISNEFTPDLNMNEYKMIKLIGSGSYANIYLVENYKTKIKYAVKKLITDNEKSIEKIKKEIEILKTIIIK